MVGDFGYGQAGKESQRHDFSTARIDRFKTCESAFEGEQILYRHRRGFGCVQQIVEFDVRKPATAFVTFLVATVIHEHAPHRLRG
jgi:hypothetical protein